MAREIRGCHCEATPRMLVARDRPCRARAACPPLFGVLLLAIGATGRADDRPPATFFRGINLNGPPVVIDGHPWEGGDAQGLRIEGRALDRQDIPLNPGTDRDRATMIRSSISGDEVAVALQGIPDGSYT